MFKCVKLFLSLEYLCASEFGHMLRGKSYDLNKIVLSYGLSAGE